MPNETPSGQEDASHAKTPLERVHEQQASHNQALAAGRAQAEGESGAAPSHEGDESRVDTSPEVIGGGPPSSARNFPQRRNQSHGD